MNYMIMTVIVNLTVNAMRHSVAIGKQSYSYNVLNPIKAVCVHWPHGNTAGI